MGVDAGTTLTPLDESDASSDLDITRKKFRMVHNGKEGWVTLTGNQGTLYVEASDSHYAVEKDLKLRETEAKTAPVLKELKIGELLHALTEPQEVVGETRMLMHVRALDDDKAGWICYGKGEAAPVKPYTSALTCEAPIAITPTLVAKDAETVRMAARGEKFQVEEGPAVDSSTGLRRVRIKTAADGVIGWATVRGAD